MKLTVLLTALSIGAALTFSSCKTTERIVIVEVPEATPTPRPRTVYVTPQATPRKAPIAAPQDNPSTFEAVTRPQSYSN